MGNQTKLIAITAAAVAIIATLGVVGVLLLEQPTLPRCPPTEQLGFSQVTFGATAGQVTLALANHGTISVTIVQVLAEGGGIIGTASISLSNSNIVLPGRTLSLTVTFPGVTFQSGTRYTFTTVSACGNKVPSDWIP